MARRRSFTVERQPIELELGGAALNAPPVIPPAVLGELLDAGNRIAEVQQSHGANPSRGRFDEMMKILDEVFALVLVPESATVFHDRLYSRTDPLDLMREVLPALEWLVEEYTDRPTEPSPLSGIGSSDGGGTSTDGAPNAPSTPSTSPPTDSATSLTALSTT